VAPFFLTQALLPSLRAGKDPLVVHITDVGGERPVSHYAHYSVSKAGLIMLTRALAVELAPHVRVNAVSPGAVAFPEDFDAAAREAVLKRIPMGREGSVEDIARTIVFLAREAPYLTGQVITVDGGRSAQL
jgi:pteridine reductase